MLIEDIVEDEGELWTEGSISWISINRYYYHGKRVQVVYGDFRPCRGAYRQSVSWIVSSVWLPFYVCFEQTKLKTQKTRLHADLLLTMIDNSVLQLV